MTTGTGNGQKHLEWAIKQHCDIAQDDMDKLQKDYEDVLRQINLKEAHKRKYKSQFDYTTNSI